MVSYWPPVHCQHSNDIIKPLTVIYCIAGKNDNLHSIVSAVIFSKKGAHSHFGVC